MITFISIIHLLIAVALVVIILIQDPKGGSMGMFGGGGSNSLFGATGTPSFLSTLTKWLCIAFAATCFTLTIMLLPVQKSEIEGLSIPQTTSPTIPTTAPVPPAPPAEGTTPSN